MKTLGLIGGMSTFSTSVYYTTINQLVNDALGGANSAPILLYSLNFQEYKTHQENGDWKEMEVMLTNIAKKLEDAGAEALLLCSNTPHILADHIEKNIRIPLLHIAKETAKEISQNNIAKVGLIGTKFTMENSFFIDHLAAQGIVTVIPNVEDRVILHEAIINEFTKGIFSEETKFKYLAIIEKLRQNGAEAIILGCTEIGLLINQSDCTIKLFDTTVIHAKAAVNFCLS